jgi:hypothetical protein
MEIAVVSTKDLTPVYIISGLYAARQSPIRSFEETLRRMTVGRKLTIGVSGMLIVVLSPAAVRTELSFATPTVVAGEGQSRGG